MSDILVVEDNADIADGLRDNLELEGYSVEIAGDGEAALAAIRGSRPQLVILDLMLPRIDGFQVLRRMREEGHEMPVLIVSARADEVDKVRGFRIGADDYVTKPFGLRELLARVDALFRRGRRSDAARENGQERIVRFGDVEVDFGGHVGRRAGEPIVFRPKELELLRALVRAPGRVVSRQRLLQEVWGYATDVVTRTVDTHVAELRRRVERDPARPQHIITVRKVGYMFRP
ncbi:MAG TPA: response regulator transcription factor [Gemmatimonadaceae bacterium]|nr:response regulator transcription factor [Gemmatimonadaceae bacterium]